MPRWTRRQLVLAAAAAALWALSVLASMLSRWSIAAAALATLALLACLILIDARAGDARLLAKINRQQRQADALARELEELPRSVGKEIRSGRRAVERAGQDTLEEVATFKLQAAAVLQQLAELNHRTRGLSGEAIEARLSENLDAGRRLLDQTAALEVAGGQGRKDLTRSLAKIQSDVARLAYEPVREIESVVQLFRRFDPAGVVPSSGGWAMSPSGLLLLTQLVETRRPGVVVECGSGASSLWLGLALRSAGSGHLFSLENDEAYARRVREELRRHELTEWVTVLDAPLTDVELDGATHRWYSPQALRDLDPIDLVVVDGPPATVQVQSRYPAVPVLESLLAADAIVVLDDANRPDERAVLARWKERNDSIEVEPFTGRLQAVLSGVARPATDQ